MKKKRVVSKIKKKKKSFSILSFPRTFGEKTADSITKWAGSWTFIILFFVFIGIWMSTNGYFVLKYLNKEIIDPYPFILLNLALSCLAAIQAPIILMSQNREAKKDRLKIEYDYAVNRKAEKEIKEIKEILLKRKK
jgi:uncharacterized membrane protein